MGAVVNKNLKWIGISIGCLFLLSVPFLVKRVYSQVYPKRLINMVLEVQEATEDLAKLTDRMYDLQQECTRSNLLNALCVPQKIFEASDVQIKSCVPIQTFGAQCVGKPLQEIRKTQKEIDKRLHQLSFYRKLLEKELEWGLEAQLRGMDPNEAQQLKEALLAISSSTQRVDGTAPKNVAYNEKGGGNIKCFPDITLGSTLLRLAACINPGEQKPLELIFKIGIGLSDLRLGEVGIKKVRLNIPKEINLARLVEIPPFRIALGTITINFKEIWRGISITPPSIPTPNIPPMSFSFSNLTSQSYNCGGAGGTATSSYIAFEWYSQTLSWLMEKCLEFPEMKEHGVIPTEEAEKCFDAQNVHLTIVQKCKAACESSPPESIFWSPAPICSQIFDKTIFGCTKEDAIERECRELFQSLGERTPTRCDLNALKNKCEELLTKGVEKVPEPCKFLPLFTEEFPLPEEFQYSSSERTCPAQTITALPPSPPGGLPRIPNLLKISFPKIIIPDIHLPEIRIPPILIVHLPNVITQDLVLPEIILCDLHKCSFPPFTSALIPPYLRIPPIGIPPIKLPPINIEGISVPIPEITFHEIKLPTIYFHFDQLLNWKNLIAFDLELPGIHLPTPRLIFQLKGINISIWTLFGLILRALIGVFSACITIGLHLPIPLVVYFPDLYISFPEFPPFLQIDFCKELNKFCGEATGKLKEVFDEIDKVMKQLQALLWQFQETLNKIAKEINERLTKIIQEQLTRKAEYIRDQIQAHLEKYHDLVQKGLLDQIPPLTIDLGVIEVPAINLTDLGLPASIPIPFGGVHEINLKNKLSFELPTIPLSKLSFQREISIKIPGFQLPNLSIAINLIPKYGKCEASTFLSGMRRPENPIYAELNSNIIPNVKKVLDILK